MWKTKISIIGLWLLTLASAKEIHVFTNGDSSMHNTFAYGIDVQGVSWILFKVKGCNDGYVRLYSGSDFSTAQHAYILFGGWGNDKCLMKPCSGCGTRYSSIHPYLHCDEFRPMWVNWTDRLLSVGRGEYVGEDTFMSTDEQRSFDVKYLGVGSGWSKNFDWMFDGPAGDYFQRQVPNGFSTRGLLASVTSESLVKCIRECRTMQGCKSVSYRKSDGACGLSGELTRISDIQLDNAWQSWIERNI